MTFWRDKCLRISYFLHVQYNNNCDAFLCKRNTNEHSSQIVKNYRRRWEFVIVVASFYQLFQRHHHLFVAIVTFSSFLHEPYNNFFVWFRVVMTMECWSLGSPCDKHTCFLLVATFFYYALLMFTIALLLNLIHLQFLDDDFLSKSLVLLNFWMILFQN